MATLFRRPRSRFYVIRWIDADGRRRQTSTHTSDRRAAERQRVRLEAELADRRSTGVDARQAMLDAAAKEPIATHFEAYLRACQAESQAARRVDIKRLAFSKASAALGLGRLADLTPEALRAWMGRLKAERLSPRTVNEYRVSINAFLNWCVRDGRLRENLVKHIPPLPVRGDRRRNRRSLTGEEIALLLHQAARQDQQQRLEPRASREAIYETALLTGLRRGELAGIEWRDIDLDRGLLRVRAEVGKAKRTDEVPLHPRLIERFRTRGLGRLQEKVFHRLPDIRTFKRDCERAGVVLVDEEGRTVDFHSLRMTYCTNLVKAGTPAAYLQRLARHADIKTTNAYYTDLGIEDLRPSLDGLEAPLRHGAAAGSFAGVPSSGEASASGGDCEAAPGSERCHQKCHQSGCEGERFTAAACDDEASHNDQGTNDKPRWNAGLCEFLLDLASKRVKGLEPSTFTLAT